MLVDTHCHLHDREFFKAAIAGEMLSRAYQNDVKKIICIGTSVNDSRVARDFALQEPRPNMPDLYWSFGIHPEKATNLTKVRAMTTDLKLDPKVLPVAIGEVGLDYHYAGYNQRAQTRLLEIMLQLASDFDLPVSFHVREAFDDFLPLLANFPGVRGVVHSFSDNKKHLRRILSQTDLYIGVNGLATYSTLPTPPLERILLETDAPFLTPTPFRGIINEPGYVRAIAQWLAGHLGQDFDTIEKETTKNAKRLFRF